MNCKEFSDLLDAFLDGALSDAEATQMQAHAAACADCAQLLRIRRDCRLADEETRVPASFSAAWRQAVGEEKRAERKRRNASSRKSWLAAAAMLVFVAGGLLISRNGLPTRRNKAVAPAYGATDLPMATGTGPAMYAAESASSAKAAPSAFSATNSPRGAETGTVLYAAESSFSAAYEEYDEAEAEEAAPLEEMMESAADAEKASQEAPEEKVTASQAAPGALPWIGGAALIALAIPLAVQKWKNKKERKE